MTANRKIINATPTQVDGIKFKSRLEASVYKTLIDRGFQPQYEPDTFVLFEGFKPVRYLKDGSMYTRKFTDITYTPDFKVAFNDVIVYIEVKGFDNDVYPYKKKMFLKLIKELPIYFLEVHNKKGLVSCIDKLIELYEQVPCKQDERAGQ